MFTLYNSFTRTKEQFNRVPTPSSPLSFYTCGPTVYNKIHLGNLRSVVVFDTWHRFLEACFGASSVRFVQNITDIDDKIIDEAELQGRPPLELSAEMTTHFLAARKAVHCLPALHPKVSDHIKEIIAAIQVLQAKGLAYQDSTGTVWFSVERDPTYGCLSNQKLANHLTNARKVIESEKSNPHDFVLWKTKSEGLLFESPFGRGRPGWHIECTAMSQSLLGGHIDIHGGGLDLIFPHHENELAQNRGICGHNNVSYWLHNGMLTVEGQKMSKSLGNFLLAEEALATYPASAVRLALLLTHYRASSNWSSQKVTQEVIPILTKWFKRTQGITPQYTPLSDLPPYALSTLGDDLNIPKLLSYLHQEKDPAHLANLLYILGITHDF